LSLSLSRVFAAKLIVEQVSQVAVPIEAAVGVGDERPGDCRGEEDNHVVRVCHLQETGRLDELAPDPLRLHPTSVEEHMQPALDARPWFAPLRDVDVPEGLHARVIRRVTGEKLVLDGWD